MLDKLKELNTEVNRLKFGDFFNLERIKQKGKVFLKTAFEDSEEYITEFEGILLIPKFEGHEKEAWENGKDQLANFLSARIEELEILEQDKNKEYLFKINELEEKLKEFHTKKNHWPIDKWTSLIGISLILIGGAFSLGLYFGNNKFDLAKNNLIENLRIFKDSTKVLNNDILKLKGDLSNCESKQN
ncbi:MAG: hypothetical protein ACX93I_14110 [Winogradskyella sp.]